MSGGRGGGGCRCMHFVQRFVQGAMPWTRVLCDRIPGIHSVHAFFACISVSPSCTTPVHTHIPPVASTGPHGIPREMEGLVAEVSRLYAMLNPGLLFGRFLSSSFPPFMLKYNTMKEKSYRQTLPPAALSPPPAHAPASYLPPGTAPGSRRKTSWMLACSPPSRRGTGPSGLRFALRHKAAASPQPGPARPGPSRPFRSPSPLLPPGNARWSSTAPRSEDPNPKPSSSR